MSELRTINVETAVDILSTHGVDHSLAATVAVHICRAMATLRAMRRLRLLAMREAGWTASREPANAYTHDSLAPEAFEQALAEAFVTAPALRNCARFTLAYPNHGNEWSEMYDEASVLGVTMHVIDSTLGMRFVQEVNAAAKGMRQIWSMIGDPRSADDGFMVGTITGLAEAGRQMRRLRSSEPYLLARTERVSREVNMRETLFAVIVMGAVMGAFNE